MATSAKSLQLQVKVISYKYIQVDHINYKHYKGVKLTVGAWSGCVTLRAWTLKMESTIIIVVKMIQEVIPEKLF